MENTVFEWKAFIWQTLVIIGLLLLYCLYDLLTHEFRKNEKLIWLLVILYLPMLEPNFFMIIEKKNKLEKA